VRRSLIVAALAGGLLLVLAPAAAAHPLGNFTVNTADRVVVGPDDVQVLHVVDTAEIPTLQLIQSPDGPDVDRDGRSSERELTEWSAGECRRIGPQLSLVLDGRRAALTVAASRAQQLPGQAGLPTSRLECTFAAGATADATVAFDDPTSAGRTGWKEVSATALCGRITGARGLPEQSPTDLLTSYPQDLLSSPLSVKQASFSVTSDESCRTDRSDVPGANQVLPRGIDRLTAGYTSFVSQRDLTLPTALLAVLLAVVLGSGHAVAPGHGKTVIAAYLVGQRGTRRQAVWLGTTVTATHTAGVLLLGALLSLTSVAAPERFVPVTEVASGLLLAAVGVFLLQRARRGRSAMGRLAGHDHPHEHQQAFEHGHTHGGHTHTHLPTQPLGWRTLATMGVAGGLVPSPSALVVLLGASALGRPVFGALLVLAYGVGMALTLTVAGLLLLRARARLEAGRWASGRAAGLLRAMPAVTATVVLMVGAFVVARGLLTFRGLG